MEFFIPLSLSQMTMSSGAGKICARDTFLVCLAYDTGST